MNYNLKSPCVVNAANELTARSERIASLEDELTRTKRALEIAREAMKNAHKACYCNRHKGFDYGEKHPTMGISKHGRWLTPKELLSGALLEIKKELGE